MNGSSAEQTGEVIGVARVLLCWGMARNTCFGYDIFIGRIHVAASVCKSSSDDAWLSRPVLFVDPLGRDKIIQQGGLHTRQPVKAPPKLLRWAISSHTYQIACNSLILVLNIPTRASPILQAIENGNAGKLHETAKVLEILPSTAMNLSTNMKIRSSMDKIR